VATGPPVQAGSRIEPSKLGGVTRAAVERRRPPASPPYSGQSAACAAPAAAVSSAATRMQPTIHVRAKRAKKAGNRVAPGPRRETRMSRLRKKSPRDRVARGSLGIDGSRLRRVRPPRHPVQPVRDVTQAAIP
jgi:hypothetical protein